MGSSSNNLSLTGRQWQWPSPLQSNDAEQRLPKWLQGLLARRGIEGPQQVARFLKPSLVDLDDPSSMADMEAATARLVQAIQRREPVVVWGDYDVDGVCSAAVMVDFLQRVGGEVSHYIPDRRSEGYGLNEAALRQLCPAAKVLVTTDCGISASQEIAFANSLGTDVIVVDHHEVPGSLPPALANLDPKRSDCAFPFAELCAAGVAFMLVVSLRRALREVGHFAGGGCAEPDLRDLLDLVAVATVADMVPLLGTNRVLVASGLRRLPHTRRPGLRALMQVAGVALDQPTTYDLGFQIGPRINARGRMSHAGDAVELLLTDDPERARLLAAAFDQANKQRRQVEAQCVAEAVARVEREGLYCHPAIVVDDPAWHPGVLGLVASRLAGRFHRPAVVIGEGGKGSARTIPGLDLAATLATTSHLLLQFGGHAAAAGLSISAERIAPFREAFAAAVEATLGAPPYVATLSPEIELPEELLHLGLVDDLDHLAPFGQKHQAPLLVARNLRVAQVTTVGEGGAHLKLALGSAGHGAIGFRMGELAAELPERIDVAFRLERNRFRGRTSLQLRVDDLRAAQ